MMKSIINYFKKYPYALVMILVVGIWATIDTINANKAQQELDKKGKYTIVTVTNIKGAHSERWVDVEFVYNGNKYESERRNETIPLSWIGEKIFIKF